MNFNRHSLYFKVFFGLWVTIMIFALTPLFFFLMSSADSREVFYNHSRKEMDKKIMLEIRTAAASGKIDEIRKVINYAEKTLKLEINIFDKEKNEILGKQYNPEVLNLLDEMADGKLVLVKTFSDDPGDDRKIRVMRAGKYIFTALPSATEQPAYLAILMAHHLHILLYIILLSSIASYIMMRYLAKPIRTLSIAADKIANGNFDVRVSDILKRKDEFGLLAEDFDTMAERLNKNRLSSEHMLRNISHELSSPLTRLRISLELARAKAGDNASQALDRIESESEKLSDMIG